MNKKIYNYVTLTSNINGYTIHDNILNQELCTIKRNEFKPYYGLDTINQTAKFISDLEEIGYRLQKLINKYLKTECNQNKFTQLSKQLFEEIGTRFNHYFTVEDMPMVANVISTIAETSRQDDCVYEYFNKHSIQYIQKKTKEKLYFDSQNPNSFDTAISNYA